MRKLSVDSWTGVLIAVAPLLLLVRCWDAPFLPFDDFWHVFTWSGRPGPLDLKRVFLLPQDNIYVPLSFLSYRLDSYLFSWMCDTLGSWAPGIRLMNCVYHAGAALFVWRIGRLLGLNRGRSLFVALVFAVHPTACETVCWAAERKNVLAGLFGYATVWAFLRFDGQKWRMPVTALLYLLALCSKPTALGLLPVLFLIDAFGGVGGLARSEPQPWRSPRYWVEVCWRSLPLCLLAGGALAMNMAGATASLMPPPGGTVFTAILTDAEVVSRYLYGVFIPVNLSMAYFVAPIESLWDPRFLGYACLLLALIAGTVWLAPNRRLAVFGWLWFVLAMSPNLNLIAIPALMQDRYAYLGMPGILMVAVAAVEGVLVRTRLDGRLAVAVAVPFVLALAGLAFVRGGLFGNMYLLFEDSVCKQPLSADARKGLSFAYAQIAEAAKRQKRWAEMDEARHHCGEQLRYAVDSCPDAERQLDYVAIASQAGKYALILQQPSQARRYFRLALDPPPWFRVPKKLLLETLARLVEIELDAGQPEEAYRLAERAVQASPTDGEALVAHALALRGLAQAAPDISRRSELQRQAERDWSYVPQSSPKYAEAQEALKASRSGANRPAPQEPNAPRRTE